MAKYLWTFVALLVLTTLTLALSFAPLGPWGPPLAIAIAAVKGTLVALYFMHLAEQRTTNWVAFLVSVLLVAVLVGIASLDVVSREVVVPLAELAPERESVAAHQ